MARPRDGDHSTEDFPDSQRENVALRDVPGSSGSVIRRLYVIIAVAVAVAAVLGNFLIFGFSRQAAATLITGVIASDLAVLVIFLARRTILRSADQVLSTESEEAIASRLAARLRIQLAGQVVGGTPAIGVSFYERWDDIDWLATVGDARRLDFCASFMDSWIGSAREALERIFESGGSVRAILPKPGTTAAQRVRDRFQGTIGASVPTRIRETPILIERIRRRAGQESATFDCYLTSTFIMHCMIRVDERLLILSPFDHFRQERIDAPALAINLAGRAHLVRWARKEFDGFLADAELWSAPPET